MACAFSRFVLRIVRRSSSSLARLGAALLTLSGLALSGCSQGGGGAASASGPKEALGRLSAEHRRNFEAWMKRPFKSCDASEAFGLRGGSPAGRVRVGVDGTALAAFNGDSLTFADASGFAIISAFEPLPGYSETRADASEEGGGSAYKLSATAVRSGAECVVKIDGQEAYKAQLVALYSIGATWQQGKRSASQGPVPTIRPLPNNGRAMAEGHSLANALAESLKPSKEGLAPLLRKLGLRADEAEKYFALAPRASVPFAFRIPNEPKAAWASDLRPELVAGAEQIRWAFDGAKRTLPLEVRIGLPILKLGAAENSADRASWKILAAVEISSSAREGLAYSVQTFSPQGRVPSAPEEAAQCLRSRAAALFGAYPSRGDLRPSVADLALPCDSLTRDSIQSARETGAILQLLPMAFAGVSPAVPFNFNGWDRELESAVMAALDRGEDVRSALDPFGATRIIPAAALYAEELGLELADAPALAASLKKSVRRMGVRWALYGGVASRARIREILRSAENSVDPYVDSTDRMLTQMAADPQAFDDLLAFALSIDPAHRAEGLRARALAREVGYAEFEETFRSILQNRFNLPELRRWTSWFGAMKADLPRFSNLAPRRQELQRLSVKWLSSSETTVDEIGSIYAALDNAASPLYESFDRLMRDLSSSLRRHRDEIAYAAALTPQMKADLATIRDASAAVDLEAAGKRILDSALQDRRPANELAQLSQSWAAAAAFFRRERERAGEGALERWDRKSVLERAIAEAWGPREFEGFEAIAEAARGNSACSSLRSASSLAKCADSSLSLFTKKDRGYFAPAWGGRYASLGREFAGWLNALNRFEWMPLRYRMSSAFFSRSAPIWASCSDAEFERKAAAAKDRVASLLTERDFARRTRLEQEIVEGLKDCAPGGRLN